MKGGKSKDGERGRVRGVRGEGRVREGDGEGEGTEEGREGL